MVTGIPHYVFVNIKQPNVSAVPAGLRGSISLLRHALPTVSVNMLLGIISRRYYKYITITHVVNVARAVLVIPDAYNMPIIHRPAEEMVNEVMDDGLFKLILSVFRIGRRTLLAIYREG